MKNALFSIGLALVLAGCGRPEPAGPAPEAQTQPPEKTAGEAKGFNEASLTQIVREALKSESSLDARRIDIENRDGVVALHGRVASEEQREKAARIVGSVGGVKSVENRLTVDDTASTGATSAPRL